MLTGAHPSYNNSSTQRRQGAMNNVGSSAPGRQAHKLTTAVVALRRTIQSGILLPHGATRKARAAASIRHLEKVLRSSPDLHVTLGILAGSLNLERTY